MAEQALTSSSKRVLKREMVLNIEDLLGLGLLASLNPSLNRAGTPPVRVFLSTTGRMRRSAYSMSKCALRLRPQTGSLIRYGYVNRWL